MTNPLVLVVDDKANEYVQELAVRLRKSDAVEAVSVHPADLHQAQVEEAALILVDFKLDEWPSRNSLAEMALKPMDGIALASVLRRHVFKRPPAIALISSNIEDAFVGVSSRNRRHQLARVESLEWVFQKDDAELVSQVVALAEAVRRMRVAGLVSSSSLDNALSIPHEIGKSGTSDVRRCIPPVGDLERITSGLAFVRWLLQRVLPYPTFIVDDFQLCARLKVPPAKLDELLKRKSQFVSLLKRFEYSGILSGFAGRRWWKAGLDEVTWVLSQGVLPDASAEWRQIAASSEWVGELQLADPVVPVDEDCIPQGELVERRSCLRLLPDDWPAYADPPYCSIERIRAVGELRAIVHPEDAWLLDDAPSGAAGA